MRDVISLSLSAGFGKGPPFWKKFNPFSTHFGHQKPHPILYCQQRTWIPSHFSIHRFGQKAFSTTTLIPLSIPVLKTHKQCMYIYIYYFVSPEFLLRSAFLCVEPHFFLGGMLIVNVYGLRLNMLNSLY